VLLAGTKQVMQFSNSLLSRANT